MPARKSSDRFCRNKEEGVARLFAGAVLFCWKLVGIETKGSLFLQSSGEILPKTKEFFENLSLALNFWENRTMTNVDSLLHTTW